MLFEKCKCKAEDISKIIFKKLNNTEADFHKKFFVEYPDIKILSTKKSEFLLVLGLNPSSSGEGKNSNPNLLGHIPLINLDIPVNVVREMRSKIVKKKLVYDPYFKTFVVEFGNLGYNPLWFNKSYLKRLLEDHKNRFNESEIEFLQRYTALDTNKYIIYAELIHYAETNSKKILPLLELKELVFHLNDYIKMLIEYLNPVAIISANAAVSHYLNDQFNEKKTCSDFNIGDCKVFLGSMLTGQRAMDIYSRIRLLTDVKTYLSKMNNIN